MTDTQITALLDAMQDYNEDRMVAYQALPLLQRGHGANCNSFRASALELLGRNVSNSFRFMGGHPEFQEDFPL